MKTMGGSMCTASLRIGEIGGAQQSHTETKQQNTPIHNCLLGGSQLHPPHDMAHGGCDIGHIPRQTEAILGVLELGRRPYAKLV